MSSIEILNTEENQIQTNDKIVTDIFESIALSADEESKIRLIFKDDTEQIIKFFSNILNKDRDSLLANLQTTGFRSNEMRSIVTAEFGEDEVEVLSAITGRIANNLFSDEQLQQKVLTATRNNNTKKEDKKSLYEKTSDVKKQNTKDLVYKELGGFDTVSSTVNTRINLLIEDYDNRRNIDSREKSIEYVWKNIITKDYAFRFASEMRGFEKLTPTQKYIAKNLVWWHFKRNEV